jgi:hypothetical protein
MINMMKPTSLYKWECMKCANRIHTYGRVRGKSSKDWLPRHLVNRVIRQHIKLYHSGKAIMVSLKKRKINGKESENLEEFF